MKKEDWNYIKDTEISSNGDELQRRVYFNNDNGNTNLTENIAFNIGVLMQQLLMFEDGDARIDDSAVLYRELNPITNEFVFITFGDIKDAIINLKRIKGLNGLTKKR